MLSKATRVAPQLA